MKVRNKQTVDTVKDDVFQSEWHRYTRKKKTANAPNRSRIYHEWPMTYENTVTKK